jgi:acyl dehydratase
MRDYANAAELATTVGEKQGPSDWLDITQERINDFAKATGDFQWIHCDPERAAKEAPGGKTIAHGFLTLSLLGTLAPQIYNVNASRIINVGSDRVRFLAPVPVGSRIRLFMTVKSSEPASGGLKIIAEASFEIEGSERPAMIADLIFLYFD